MAEAKRAGRPLRPTGKRIGDGSERWHGTTGGYTNHDCRCDGCRAAHREATTRRRLERHQELLANPNLAQHGKYTTYCNWMCRCEECTLAWRVYCRDVQNRRR